MASTFADECPICFNGFWRPKILLCAHVVCRSCVLSMLETGGTLSSCPLCRVPIIDDPISIQRWADLVREVDSWPSDLATPVILDSLKMVTPPHVCNCSREACFFCVELNIKLCKACNKCHVIRHSCSSRVIEELDGMTAEQLAAQCMLVCSGHSNMPANLFCTQHEDLVCAGCKTHKSCEEMMKLKDIADIAPVKREEMRCQVKILAEKEAEFIDKISLVSNLHTRFKARRSGLAKASTQHEHQLKSDIDSWLGKLQSHKVHLEKVQTRLIGHRKLSEQLVAHAPYVALLDMVKRLMQRLQSQTLWSMGRRQQLQDEAERELERLCEAFEKSLQQSSKEEKCEEKP